MQDYGGPWFSHVWFIGAIEALIVRTRAHNEGSERFGNTPAFGLIAPQ